MEMEIKFEKQLFNLFSETADKFDLYNKVKTLFIKFEKDLIGEENAKHYQIYVDLMNNINNAGWEEKKDYLMKVIRKQENYIIDNYEDYLY